MLWGLGFHIEINKEIFKNFLVLNRKGRAFIFGTLHLLVNRYQVCSYEIPRGQNWPQPRGVTSWNIETKKPMFSENGRYRALTFGMQHLLVDLSTKFVHMMPLGSRLAPPWGHKFEYRNKDGKIQNSSLNLVCSIALWTFISFIHMIPLGSKLAQPRRSQVRTIVIEKVEFILWGK